MDALSRAFSAGLSSDPNSWAMPQADVRRAFGAKQIPKTGLSDGTRCV